MFEPAFICDKCNIIVYGDVKPDACVCESVVVSKEQCSKCKHFVEDILEGDSCNYSLFPISMIKMCSHYEEKE